jgi:hypothetical protein
VADVTNDFKADATLCAIVTISFFLSLGASDTGNEVREVGGADDAM